MRILFFTSIFPRPQAPNLGIFCFRLCEALRANGHELKVISPQSILKRTRRAAVSPLPGLAEMEPSYPRYFHTPRLFRHAYDNFMWMSVGKELRRSIAEFRPDCVVSYWSHPDGAVAVRAAREAGLPSAVIVGGSDILVVAKNDRRRRERIARTLQNADVVVARSRDLKMAVVKLGVDENKINVIPQGIDGELFSPGDRAEALLRLGLKPAGRKLLFVGNLVPVKGLEVLLAAFKHVRESAADAELFMLGQGPLRKKLEEMAKSLGIEQQVHFIGPVPQAALPNWYRAVDLTVMSSHSEGIPNVLRESMACGTPWVATAVGGISEIARPGLSELVPANDPLALARGIVTKLGEGQQGPHKAAVEVTWKESARQLVDAITQAKNDSKATVQINHRTIQQSARQHGNPARQAMRSLLAGMLPPRSYMLNGRADTREAYLTFDDGPHPEHTPRLLDALKSINARATFFVIGERVRRHPDIVRRIAAEGHAIGNHTMTHSEPATTTARQFLDEVRQTGEILADILGYNPIIVRPPKGKLTARKLSGLVLAGRTVVLWSVDPKDYATTTSDAVREFFTHRRIGAGDIILMHDIKPHAAEIMHGLDEQVRRQGLSWGIPAGWLPAKSVSPSGTKSSVHGELAESAR